MKKLILSAITALGLSATMINLNQGWNLIGSSNSVDLSKNLNNSNIKIVWRWHNGEWQAFSPNENIKKLIEKKGFTYFTITAAYEGFWVYANNPTSIEIDNAPTTDLPPFENQLPLIDTPTKFEISDVANKTFKVAHADFKFVFDENGNGKVIEGNRTLADAIFNNGIIKVQFKDNNSENNSYYLVEKLASNDNGIVVVVNHIDNNENMNWQFLDAWINKENPVDMSTLNYPITFYLDKPELTLTINNNTLSWGGGEEENYTIEDGKIVVKHKGENNGDRGEHFIDKLQIVDNIGRYTIIKDNVTWVRWYIDENLTGKTFDDIKDTNISIDRLYLRSDNTIASPYENETITYNEINSTYIQINRCWENGGCEKEVVTLNPNEGKVEIIRDYNFYIIASTSPIFKDNNTLDRKKPLNFREYLKQKENLYK